MKTVLVTGSSGLIGSEVCTYFGHELGYAVHGVDNNQRAVFFGPQGDTRWNQQRLQRDLPGFVHHELDIRDRAGVRALVAGLKPSAIVHAAAQPSHDRAAAIPFDDFDTNATGTLNLLEAARQVCPESPFVHMSTNKVYGDAPNRTGLARAGDALGLCRCRVRERHSRDVHDRSIEALAVRRVEGGGRRPGPGVRPLLRHADVLPARRLPDRTQPQRRRAAWVPVVPGDAATSRDASTRCSATRASRCATTFTRWTSRGSWRPSSRRRGRARSTTWAAARTMPAPFSRPSP